MSLVACLLVVSLPRNKINGNYEITFNFYFLVKRYDIETVRDGGGGCHEGGGVEVMRSFF